MDLDCIHFLDFAKEHKLDGTLKICTEYAARNKKEFVLDRDFPETLEKHPEIAIKMLENLNVVNNLTVTETQTLTCFDTMTPYELRVHSAEEQKVEMILEVNHSVFITGLGLSVLPGSQFSVRVQVKKNSKLQNRRALVNDSHTWTTHTISTQEKSHDQIMMVELDQKFEIEADTSAIITNC